MFKKEKEFYDEKVKEHKERADALAVELEESRSIINGLQKEKYELMGIGKQNSQLKEEIGTIKLEKKEIDGELQKVLEKLNESKEVCLKLTEEKDTLEKNMLIKFNEYVSFQTKVETLTEDLKERKAIMSEVQAENKELTKKIGAMEVDIKTLNRYIEDKNKEIIEKDAKIYAFEAETRDLKERMTKLELERVDFVKKVEKYEKLL